MEQAFCKSEIIEVVLFDFGGVLADEGWKKGLRVIAAAHGLDEDDFIRAASDIIYDTGYIMGKGSESDFWESLRRKTGIRGGDASLTQELLSRFILNKHMVDTARKLRSQNITVGILSDQTNWLDMLNFRFDFFKYFDHVFNSYHLGKGKRDISLFDDIAKLLRKAPDGILFIDDDPGNVARARQRGWKAILYTDEHCFDLEMDEIIFYKKSNNCRICSAKNIFADIPENLKEELLETLLQTPGCRVERIVSQGHASREGLWYDQDENEWVILLQGSAGLRWEGRKELVVLHSGDYIRIPAHSKHRVEWTAADCQTVWLAVYYK